MHRVNSFPGRLLDFRSAPGSLLPSLDPLIVAGTLRSLRLAPKPRRYDLVEGLVELFHGIRPAKA